MLLSLSCLSGLTPCEGPHTGRAMANSMRMERVARQLRAALSEVLLEGLKDPRVGPLTLTTIRVSPDLRHANIGFLPLGGVGDAAEMAEGLHRARGFIQRKLARRLRMKYLPVLRFYVDEQIEQAMEIDSLLNQLDGRTGEE